MADVGTLAERLRARFADAAAANAGTQVLEASPDLNAPELAPSIGGPAAALSPPRDCTTLLVPPGDWVATAQALRDDFGFEQMVDLCGVDYLGFGSDEWDTRDVSSEGFSRGVQGLGPGRFVWGQQPSGVGPEHRYAVVMHLLSVQHNQRLRLRCFCTDDALPVIGSVTGIWPVADWFEREAFDLYGIIFEGHPDLRRILTDYGFVGHPFRKDFPLIGNVEVIYDAATRRVIYQPVSIEPRVLVPRVIRDDARYQTAEAESETRILAREVKP